MKTREKKSETGKVEDVEATQEIAGSKVAAFGLAIDSEGRSNPTHMVPFHVRKTLASWWSNTAEFKAADQNGDKKYSDSDYLSWYEEDESATHVDAESVAGKLSVTVSDAEDMVNGVPSATNSFLNYTDTPLNQGVNDRLSFWAYNQNAIEFDDKFNFEAQMEGVDAFSQLFAESFDFHFQFLATLDQEYHRLRGGGALGVMDSETNDKTPWHAMYHYWRDHVKAAYLDTQRVELPTGLENSNWTIADVLTEILRKCVTADGQMRPDMVVSLKGLARAKSGISLGIYNDPGMVDNDGNVRFYMPAWKDNTVILESSVRTPASKGASQSVETLMGGVIDFEGDDLGFGELVVVQTPATETGVSSYNANVTTVNYKSVQENTWAHTLEIISEMGRQPLWMYENGVPTNVFSLGTNFPTLTQGRCDAYMQDLPGPDGLLGGNFGYWRGHQLNIVDLIEVSRRLGRVLEPEVASGFLPAMGTLQSIEPLFAQPSGLSARLYDDLINMYSSSFSYNENPARKYTTAHLGPLDRGVAKGQLTVGDQVLHTEYVDGDGETQLASVRDRYWTPGSLTTAEEKAEVLAFFMPGGVIEIDMLGKLNLTKSDSPFVSRLDGGMLGRLMGTVSSMHTKVEKPVVLPAGISSPEATYASGIGVGAAQLLAELMFSAFNGKQFISLGHNGFIDWRTDGGYQPVTRDVITAADPTSWMIHAGHAGVNQANELATYAITKSIAENVLSLAGVDPLGISTTIDSAIDQLDVIGEEMATSLLPVGSAEAPSGSMAHVTRVTSDSASTSLMNVIEAKLPTASSYGLLSMPETAVSDDANRKLFLGSVAAGDTVRAMDLSVLPLAMTAPGADPALRKIFAMVPLEVEISKQVGNSTKYHTMKTPFGKLRDGDIISEAEVFGDGSAFLARAAFDGTLIDEPMNVSQVSIMPIGSIGSTDLSVDIASLDIVGSPIANSDGAHTRDTSQTRILPVPMDLNAHDLALIALQDAPPSILEHFMSGTQDINVKFKMDGMITDLENVDSDTGGNIGSGSFHPSSTSFINEVFAANYPDAPTFAYWRHEPEYTLKWSNYTRDVPFEMDVTFVRNQVGSEGQDRLAESKVTSQSHLIPKQSNSGLIEDAATLAAVGYNFESPEEDVLSYMSSVIPVGNTDSIAFSKSDAVSNLHSVLSVAYNPRESPGGDWGDMTVTFNDSEQLVSLEAAWPISQYLQDKFAVQQSAGNQFSQKWLNVRQGLLDNFTGLLPYFGRTGWTDQDHNPLFSEIPPFMAVGNNLMHMGINDKRRSYGTASTSTRLVPRTLGLNDLKDSGITSYGNYASSLHAYNLSAGEIGCVTYLIPDDPENRMVYRPYRRLVDAAILKELRLLMVPTHERYDGAGGPIGLPFYGSPTPFRFAQLVFDANKSDQFILEPAASKSRMIDASNRGLLTFGKIALLDVDTQKHELLPVLRDMNNLSYLRSAVHASSISGTEVYTKGMIREVQLGRQMQRFS